MVVDEHSDSFVFVCSADADVVHSGVDAQGDGAGVVDAVLSDAPVAVGSGWGASFSRIFAAGSAPLA